MKYKAIIFTVFALTTLGIVNAEYSYPEDSHKHSAAISIGAIGTYGSQCEKTSSFYSGLKLLQWMVIELGWGVTEQAEHMRVVLEVARTDEFKQGANSMYREGCDSYKQGLQPLVNDVLEAIK